MIQNPLHIYVDTESQNDKIEEKTKGIYQLKKGATSFKVSIKEYEDLVKEHREAIAKAEKDCALNLKKINEGYYQYYDPYIYAKNKWHSHVKQGVLDEKKLNESFKANQKYAEDKLKEEKEREEKENDICKKKVVQSNAKIAEIDSLFKDVVWIYQLAGNNLPKIVNENSFNEAIKKGSTSINVSINDLDTGGGFVYVQPYLYNKGYVPETNLQNSAIYFKYSDDKPKIIGAAWYKDKEGKEEISTPVKYGSTLYLLIKTKDLYGQLVTVEFKDDDSYTSKDEKNSTDDDLGIYPESGLRNDYKVNSDIPATIKKDSQLQRMVKTFEWQTQPSDVVSGTLNIADANKHDGKVSSKTSFQGAFFAVYIDHFWSKEANVGRNESEIDVFPTVSRSGVETAVLKSATLKVSNEGTLINPSIDRSNKPLLVGEVDSDFADFMHCRYNTIKLSEKGKAPITVFDKANLNQRRTNPILIDVIAGKKASYFLDIDFETDECNKSEKHINNEILVAEIPKNYKAKVTSGGRLANNIEEEQKKLYTTSSSTKTSLSGSSSTSKNTVKAETGLVTVRKNQVEFDAFYNYDIPDNKQADPLTIFSKAMNYIRLDNIDNKVKHIKLKASSCAYDKQLNIAIYPDIKWTLKFGFNATKEDIEALNNKGLKTPLTVFKALEDEKDKLQETADKKDKAYLDENNHLKKIKNKQLNEARKAFKLKKKTKKSSQQDITPVAKGKMAGLIEILKRINISLAEEHYGGDQANELNEEFVKQLYNRYQAQFELIVEAAEIIEGVKDAKPFSAEDEKSIQGLTETLNRKPVEYNIEYPKLALAASWFYEMIDPKQYPLLVGRQGLGLDINLSAKPLIGMTIKWDLLELLCRRHPIAYAILKAVQGLIYILGKDGSAITCDFTVTGQIDAEVQWQHNMLAGFKDLSAKGKSAVNAKIEFKINIAQTYKVLKYEVIVQRGFSAGASSGLGITDNFGVDSQGFYSQKILEFEGIKFEFSATGIVQVKAGKEKDPLFDLGGEINGEITFLDYKFEAPKMYLTI